ncbi:hypothetical protein I4U23_010756 [Adineta vaga]|nr:hypothetical protein I4U23_010756 [Adineta vaga]
MSKIEQNLSDDVKSLNMYDVIIIGAGFSGLYMLHRLRELGISVRILEGADGIGGTWYWNRYPGARCDIESLQYSYSFSEDLRHEWNWKERYASQPEILQYLNYVADKFHLRNDIQLKTRVKSAIYDETSVRWNIQTDNGDTFLTKFCIMATGCLSIPKEVDIKGVKSFKGNTYYTSQWPHETIHFNDQRVAVIGTGSSGVQSIPMIAEEAIHVYVFQRTPCFTVPAKNVLINEKDRELWNQNYDERREKILQTYGGIEAQGIVRDQSAISVTSEIRQQTYEERWKIGGISFLFGFNDLFVNKESNDTAVDFISSKIRQKVKNPIVAESLIPHDYPIGSKRLCVDTNYYETFNRDNVTLVDLRKENIEEITSSGIKTTKMTYEIDSIVFATGFDAMTGALLKIDIRGRSGCTIQDKWSEGPRTYLGLMTADFPNLFIIAGPGSPSVLTNMIVSIEQHVDWIVECLDYLRKHHFDTIEATMEAQDAWVNEVNAIANATLVNTANSWYLGANVPGKPRIFMPYAGGIVPYRQKCDNVAANNYQGFQLKENKANIETK